MVSVHCGRVRRFLKDTKGVFSLVSVSEDLELKKNGPVVYWMSRDQRADDNWALLYARELANQTSVALEVVFNLVPKFLEATERQYEFMLKGLEETEITLRKKSIPFHLLMGHPKETMPNFIHSKNASALVTDFSPLRTPKAWSEEVAKKLDENVPMFVVDAHNVVPVWITSDKQEYAARTIRSKINKKAPEYLVEFPELEKNSKQFIESLPEPVDWKKARKSLEIDRTLKPVDWILPGSSEGKKVLQEFCTDRLPDYADKRNDPLAGVLSNLSPYFHFGQIAPQRAIMEVQKYAKKHSNCSESMKAFVEETMIRRELSDNFCYYQQNYDNIDGASDWAKETLKAHAKDKREYVYTQEEFEQAKTHSKFWNAMQTQLVLEGKLHGVRITILFFKIYFIF